MLEKEKFLQIINPLTVRFGNPGKRVLDIDYEYLKHFSEEALYLAVDQIITSRQYQSYPSLGELYEIMESVVAKDEDITKEEDYICGACCDEGIVVWPDTDKATFCSCEKGLRKRAAFLEYRRTGDARRAQRAFEEADVSGAKPGPRIYRKRGSYREMTGEWEEKVRKKLEWQNRNIGKK